VSHAQVPLFNEAPYGFQYRYNFVTPDEETLLIQVVARIAFSTFEIRGVAARRRVAFFGRSYNSARLPAEPLPAFLIPFRDRVAAWADVGPEAFVMALINEYPPGAPIGWHRDAPQYGIVAGISLLSSCRMKFRPYIPRNAEGQGRGPRRTASHAVTLEPRSAYLMTGESRSAFEHHIPAVTRLRYSITFRTARF
jgi:alkylated DNA repair dioxygenase AlkB